MNQNNPIENKISKTSLRPLFPTKYDQTLFVNREKELSIIQSSIRSKLNLLLLGNRGSGKTSLLNHSYYNLRKDEKIIPILVNILPKEISGSEDFLDTLIESCINEISHNEANLHIYKKLTSLFDVPLRGLNGFQKLIDRIQKEEKIAIFLIDGFDHHSQLCYDILSALREIFWETKFPFIFIGDIKQKNVYLKPPVDAFFDKVIEMGKFSPSDVKKLFEYRIGSNNISEKVFSAISEYNGSSITDIILLMRENIEKNNSKFDTILKTSNTFTIGATIAPSITITNPNTTQSNIELKISPMRKEVLRYLRINGPTSASDKKFQEYTGVTRSRLAQMLSRLTNMGLLTKSQDSQNRRTLFGLTAETRNRLAHE